MLFRSDKVFDLTDIDRLILVGGGKASFGMAGAVEEAIGSLIDTGLIVTKYGRKQGNLEKTEVLEASHPVPDRAGLEATENLLDLAGSAEEGDLVIVLISGGGSALLTLPLDGVGLEEVKRLTEDLLESGASIGEINTVRKRLSRIKGGRLARAIHPARGLVLVISDVVGDDLRYIASGPAFPENSTREDALNVLEKYDLKDSHSHVIDVLAGNGRNSEPVTEDEFSGFDITNQIVASNKTALAAMARKAEKMGINPLVLSSMLEGESRYVGGVIGQLARSISSEQLPLSDPAVLLSGGETTVTLSGGFGTGGPNQEFTLAAGREILELSNTVVGAIDSDGEDGSTEIAGGLISGEVEADREKFTACLDDHDSSDFLKELGSEIVTGQTGTNVNDLRLALVL